MDPRGLGAFLALGLLFAGCVTDAGVTREPDAAPLEAQVRNRPVVVALLDSGINPYHEIFHREAGDSPWTPREAMLVALASQGDYSERVESDRTRWEGLESDQLYQFEGTRLLAISKVRQEGIKVVDMVGHGTGTASLVARDAPGAIIVMVQVNARTCLTQDTGECLIDPSVADGMEWIAEQPWIDIVSTSITLLGNSPDDPRIHDEMRRYLAASRAAAESGKILLNAAGNTGTPTLFDYFPGPPWVIAVGGAELTQSGAALTSSQGVDVVANYTEFTARANSTNESEFVGGTSYATPIVAATLAKTIRELNNTAWTSSDLRAALNRTAMPFDPAAWSPTAPAASDPNRALFSKSLPVLAQGPQAGWGYVHAGLAPRIVVEMSPVHPAGEQVGATAAWQRAWQDAREQHWHDA